MKKIYSCFFILLILFTFTVYADENFRIKLNKPTSDIKLERIPGQSWNIGGGCNCLMCVGNHLRQNHNIPSQYISHNLSATDYLAKIGYQQWSTLHDNLHNDPQFLRHKQKKDAEILSLFAPTPIEIIQQALELATITSKDTVYDLGCGDGRVVILASGLYDCKSVGIDIDKDCANNALENVQLNDLENLVKIYHGDITKVDFSDATVVFTYLMPDLTFKLLPKFNSLKPGTRIIAYDKPILDLRPSKQIGVKLLDETKHTIFLYIITKKPKTSNFL